MVWISATIVRSEWAAKQPIVRSCCVATDLTHLTLLTHTKRDADRSSVGSPSLHESM